MTLIESSFFRCLPLQFDQPPWSSSRKTFRLPLVNHKVTVVELDSFGRGWNFELLISDSYSSVYILHITNLKSLIWWTIQIYQTWHHVERFLLYVWISLNCHIQTFRRLTYYSFLTASAVVTAIIIILTRELTGDMWCKKPEKYEIKKYNHHYCQTKDHIITNKQTKRKSSCTSL